MEFKKILVLLTAVFALAFVIANVSATSIGTIDSIKVNDVELLGTGSATNVAAFAGETLPVRVRFVGSMDSSDATVKVWISGARNYPVSTGEFKVFNGSVYSKLFAVTVPSKLDPTEELTLNVLVESMDGGTPVTESVPLAAQRESYVVDFLDVNVDNRVKAGSNLALDIVLKNRGLEFAEDTFVRARISALGIEQSAYFGDLAPIDQPVVDSRQIDQEDAVEKKLVLRIPSDASPGIYLLELEAFNGDTSTTLTKKIAIVGASEDSMVVSSSHSKTFAVGEKATYTVTLVNSGNNIKVYELLVENSNDNLNVNIDEPIVAVPAGSSRTVKVEATATKAGKYDFTTTVQSGGDVVKKETFTANVEGSTRKAFSGNTAVVLTVVLAIVFVVLLIVLIVLLTRKPEKSQEIGESYY